MLSKSLSVLAVAASAAALNFDDWSPAGPSDSRGPCPGLNSMANHGFIPHDGQSLTVPLMVQALNDVYSVNKDVGILLSVGALFAGPNPLGLTFDLSDLDKHNFIEHDGSLSRSDLGDHGDDHTFEPSVFAAYMSAYAGLDNTTTEAAAKGKFARVSNESKIDPDFTYGAKQFILSYAETALLMKVMGNSTDSFPVDWLPTFFAEEKLPYEQGWLPPSQGIGYTEINAYIPELIEAAGDEVPEGLIIGNNTLARALLGLDNLAEEIPSMVQHLLNEFGLGSIL